MYEGRQGKDFGAMQKVRNFPTGFHRHQSSTKWAVSQTGSYASSLEEGNVLSHTDMQKKWVGGTSGEIFTSFVTR